MKTKLFIATWFCITAGNYYYILQHSLQQTFFLVLLFFLFLEDFQKKGTISPNGKQNSETNILS